jgi:hypothetical protein
MGKTQNPPRRKPLTPAQMEKANRELWERIDAISKSVPPEEWAKLPKDFAANHRKYRRRASEKR